MKAWVELIGRDQLVRDENLMRLMRTAHHADHRGFKETAKRLRDHGA